MFLTHEYFADGCSPEIGEVIYRVTTGDANIHPHWFYKEDEKKMKDFIEKNPDSIIDQFEILDSEDFDDARLGPIAELELSPISPDHPKYKAGF